MQIQEIDVAFEFVRNGLSIKQRNGASGIPITRIETIWNCEIDKERFGYADIVDIEQHQSHLLQGGDILMSHINSPKHLGKSAVYLGEPENLIHGMNLLCLRPDKNVVNPQYINYFFATNFFKGQIAKISNQSVNQASFSAGKFKKLKIPLPPLQEQKKIAEILDAAESLRQKDKQLIEKYNELSQSLFLDMFGDTFLNPKRWIIEDVANIASEEKYSIKAGPFGSALKKEFYVSHGYKIYGQEQVIKDDLKFGDYYISNEKYKELESCKVKSGDVLISLVGTYGKIAVVPHEFEEGIINPRLMKISPNLEMVRSDFLKTLLRSKGVEVQLKNFSRGGTMDIINVGIIKKVKIPVPPIKMQDLFAERVQEIRKQKQQAQESLQKSEELFNSLMQRAFKGELTG